MAPGCTTTDTCSTWVDDELEARGIDAPDEFRPGCCVKDAEDAAKAARLRRVLRAADPTIAAVQRRFDALAVPSDALEDGQQDGGEDTPLSDESSDFGEDDSAGGEQVHSSAALEDLRAQRLRQLRAAASRAQDEGVKRGSGEYLELRDAAAVEALVKAHAYVVLHLPLPGVDACARTDELLSAAARTYTSTCFVRLPDASSAGRVTGTPIASLPMLLVCRRGVVKAIASGLAPFGGASDFDERAVTKWLSNARALRTGSRPALDESGSSSEDNTDGTGGGVVGPLAPCPSCGRTYPHEHVRALRPRGLAVHSDEEV